jgi:hypothetical protein
MAETAITRRKDGQQAPAEAVELATLTERVRTTLRRSAADLLAIGADLNRAKALLGHGSFGPWLDREFALSRRSAEQFMAAARRFGKGEAVSHLPAGAVVELSAPSVPDELVERVLSGEVPASASAIREERAGDRMAERSYEVAGTFIDHLDRFNGTVADYAAGIAAHVLRRWKQPKHRAWFARAMGATAELIESNLETKIPLLELPRTTVRKLKQDRRD